MDRNVAELFGRLQKIVVNGSLVPFQGTEPMQAIGLKHDEFLALGEAGLLNSGNKSKLASDGDEIYFFLHGRRKVVRAHMQGAERYGLNLDGHLLTTAGEQLVAVGDFSHDEAVLNSILVWIEHLMPTKASLFIADVPAGRTADTEGLQWAELPRRKLR